MYMCMYMYSVDVYVYLYYYMHLHVVVVEGLAEAGDDGLNNGHEEVLKKRRYSLLVLGDELVQQRNELLDLLGLHT